MQPAEVCLGQAISPRRLQIRIVIQQQSGWRPTGPVKILTHMRYWGHCFNPVSFYFAYEHVDGTPFDAASDKPCQVAAVVAEVSNTPWNEMHPYVMHPGTANMTDQSLPPVHGVASQPAATASSKPARSRSTERSRANERTAHQYETHPQRLVRFDFPKAFHVSPFMPMEQMYNWAFTPPGRTLCITGRTRDEQGQMFLATFYAGWSPLTANNLAWHLVCMPLMTIFTVLGILWQAIVVWFMGIPSFSHPHGRQSAASRWVHAILWPVVGMVQYLFPGTQRDSAEQLTEAFTLETTQ